MHDVNEGLTSGLYKFRLVLWQLTKLRLVLRYRRTFLGYLWTLVSPLLTMAVTAVAFSAILKVDIKTYTVFLFGGMVPWTCFSSIVLQSGGALVEHEGLIKKVYLPKIIFPLSMSLSMFIDSLLSFGALFLLVIMIGGKISPALCFIPVAYIFLFFLSLGVALLLSVMTVFFRDLQHITGVFMQAFFFLTPVIYRKEDLQGRVGHLIEWNPLTPVIELFRYPLTMGALPAGTVVLHSAIFSLAVFLLGLCVFKAFHKRIIYRL